MFVFAQPALSFGFRSIRGPYWTCHELLAAARNGHDELVARYLAKGANPNGHGPNPLMLKSTTMNRLFMEIIDSPLHDAVYFGHGKVVYALLAAKAAVNIRDAMGAFPLWYAAARGHVDIVCALVDAGAIDTFAENLYPGAGSALARAAKLGSLPMCRALLAAPVYPASDTRKRLEAAMELAGSHEHFEVVRLLEEHLVILDATTEPGEALTYFRADENSGRRLADIVLTLDCAE
ncbi:MAG: ankyrin repeat protein 17 [Gammaproteobacteria bacterium]|nr:ankyrin repeat protein 17 [Gammaproteobacteria bacterium]